MTDLRASRGVRAGLWAAFAQLLWFTIVDVVRGQPLSSLAYMSGLVFSFTTALPATARVLAMIAILFVTFALLGALTVAVLRSFGFTPGWVFGLLVGAVVLGLGYLVGTVIFGVNLPRALGWGASIAGDLLSGLVMIAYLRRRRAAA